MKRMYIIIRKAYDIYFNNKAMKLSCMSFCLRCFIIGEHILEECKDKTLRFFFPYHFPLEWFTI